MPQAYGGFDCHELIDKGPFHEVWRAAAPGEDGPGSYQVRVIRHPGGSLPGPSEWEETCRRQLARWGVQQRAAAADPARFAPVYPPSPARHESGVFLVTDYYPLDIARVITGPYLIDSASLQVIMSRVYAAMMSIERSLGRPHGRITAESVHLDATRVTPRTRVVLSEPEADDDLRIEEARARDVRALGELIYCLTTRERHAPDRGTPPPDLEAFSRYRRHASRWRELCIEMLEVGPAVDLDELRRMRYPQRFPRPDDQPLLQYAGVLCALAAVAAGTWFYNTSRGGPPPWTVLTGPLAPWAGAADLDTLACAECPLMDVRDAATRILQEGQAAELRMVARQHVEALAPWTEAEEGRTVLASADAAAAEVLAQLQPGDDPAGAPDAEALEAAAERFAEAMATLTTFNTRAGQLEKELASIESGDLSAAALAERVAGVKASMRVSGGDRRLADVVTEWHAALVSRAKAGTTSAASYLQLIKAEYTGAAQALERVATGFSTNKHDHYMLGGRTFQPADITSGRAELLTAYQDDLSSQKDTPANPLLGLADDMRDYDTRRLGLIGQLNSLEGLQGGRQAVAGLISELEQATLDVAADDVPPERWNAASVSRRQEIVDMAAELRAAMSVGHERMSRIASDIPALALDPREDPRSALGSQVADLESRIGSATTTASFQIPAVDAVIPEKLDQFNQDVSELEAARAAARATLDEIRPLLNLDEPPWTYGNGPAVRASVAQVPRRLLEHKQHLDSLEQRIAEAIPKDPASRRLELIAAIEAAPTGDGEAFARSHQELIALARLTEKKDEGPALEELARIETLWSSVQRLQQVRSGLTFSDQLDRQAFDDFVDGWIRELGPALRFLNDPKEIDALTQHLLELREINALLDVIRISIDRFTPLDQPLDVTIGATQQVLPLRAAIAGAHERLDDLLFKQGHFRTSVSFTRGEQLGAFEEFVSLLEQWGREIGPKTSNAASWQESGRDEAWRFARRAFDNATGPWADAQRWYAYVDGFLVFEPMRMVDLNLDELEVDRAMHTALRDAGTRRQVGDRIPAALYASRVMFHVRNRWTGIDQVRAAADIQGRPDSARLLDSAADRSLNDGRRTAHALAAVDAFADEISTLAEGDLKRTTVEAFERRFADVQAAVAEPWRRVLSGSDNAITEALRSIRPSGAEAVQGPTVAGWTEDRSVPDVRRFNPPAGAEGAAALEFIEIPGESIFVQRTELSLAHVIAILDGATSAEQQPWVKVISDGIAGSNPPTSVPTRVSLASGGRPGHVRGFFPYLASGRLTVIPTLTWTSVISGDIPTEGDAALPGTWQAYLDKACPPDLGPQWWAQQERWPASAGTSLPLHNVTFAAASAIAHIAGCRLPTPHEWKAAWTFDQQSGDLDASRWNTSDRTWVTQRDFKRQRPDDEYAPAPWAGSFRATAAPLEPFGWPAATDVRDDGWLWLRPVDRERAGSDRLEDLVGNVAEWADERAGSRTVDVLEDATRRITEPRQVHVMGVSAMSGHAPPDADVPIEMYTPRRGAPYAADLGEQFSDVGLRLVFDKRRSGGSDRPKVLRDALAATLSPPASP